MRGRTDRQAEMLLGVDVEEFIPANHPIRRIRRNGRPMYREQHGRPCQTNRRAFMAEKLDSQIEDIFCAIQLPDSTLCQIADRATRNNAKGAVSLLESRRRLARAYGDGAYPYDEVLGRLKVELDTLIAERAGA